MRIIFLSLLVGLISASEAVEKAADKKCKKEEAMKVAVETYRRAWDNYNQGNFAKMALSYQPGAQFTFAPDPADCGKTISLDLVPTFSAAYAAGDRGEYILKSVEWDELERTVKIRSTDLHGPMGMNLTAVDAQVYFSSDYGCNYKVYSYVASNLKCAQQ